MSRSCVSAALLMFSSDVSMIFRWCLTDVSDALVMFRCCFDVLQCLGNVAGWMSRW